MSEFRRPSTWVLAGALGLLAPGVVILADIERGQMQAGAWYLWLGLTTAAAVLGAIHAGWGLVLAVWWLATHWPRPAARPEPLPAAPAPRTVYLRRVPVHSAQGVSEIELPDTRPAHWDAWQDAARRVVGWWHVRHSLSAEALVGHAVASREAWVRLTDALAAAGLARKSAGRRTEWCVNTARVLALLDAGALAWPEAAPPPVTEPPRAPIPHPTPTA